MAALSGEREASFMLDALAADPAPSLSAGTLLEARIVMQARCGDEGVRDLDLLLQAADVTVVPVTRDQGDVAIEGFRRFGKGRHAAALNDGDLFAYGLASLRAEALLFVGDDFVSSDVTAASTPST